MIIAANSLPYKITAFITLLVLIVLSSSIALAEDTATSSTTSRETRKEAIEERIDTRRTNIEERVIARKDRIATREAALKEKLAKFKDKQKAQIAERINASLTIINEKITSAMSRHLQNMSGIMDKLEERVNRNTPDIKDPAAVKTALLDAREAIASAEAAVVSQSEKDYTIEATAEARIRDDAKIAKDKLHTDLKMLREMVISAKQKVSEAIRIAKSNAGGNKENGQ